MRKTVIVLFMIFLIGVLALEVAAFINILNARQQLESIEIIY